MYQRSISCINIHDRQYWFFQIQQVVKQDDYLNELPKYILYMDNSWDSFTLNDHLIYCFMYASDLFLRSSTSIGVQSKLNILGKYCNDWCLSVNLSKTKNYDF